MIALNDLLEARYELLSTASTKDEANDVRRDLMDAFNNYVSRPKPAYNILPLLAGRDEPVSTDIIQQMTSINDLAKSKSFQGAALFEKVKKLNNLISNLAKNNHKAIRDSIHNSYVIRRDTDRNEREMAKSKFEQVVFHKLNSVLMKQRAKLAALIGIKDNGSSDIDTIPQELSQQDIWMFRKTPAAEQYGLDDGEVWAQVWADPEMKAKISTLVRAIKRGHMPVNGPEVAAETQKIMDWFKTRQTNQHVFEAGEDEAQQTFQTKVDPAEQWSEEMLRSKKLKQEEPPDIFDEEVMERKKKERDEAVKKHEEEMQRRKDMEEGLISKYNGSDFARWMRR